MASNDETTPEHITLKSSNGRDFTISKSAAALSSLINKKLSRAKPPKPNEIPLNKVDGETLHHVVTYLNAQAAAGDDEEKKKKKADEEFLPGQPEVKVLFDVAVAANRLGIQGLTDIVSGKIAESIKKKPVDWVRKIDWSIRNAWAFEGVDPDDEE